MKFIMVVFGAALAPTILVSCGYMVKADPALDYANGNYLSVETNACGLESSGPNGCYISEGQDVSGKVISVQGFYKGEIEIYSGLCGINVVERYGMNEKKNFVLSNLYRKAKLARKDSCTFFVIMKPDVIEKTTEKMYPRIARVFVEVLPAGVKALYLSRGEQVEKSTRLSPQVTIDLPVKSNGKFQVYRCAGDALIGNVVKGKATIPELDKEKDCKYQIAFKLDSGEKYIWIFYRNVYDRGLAVLPQPIVTRNGKNLCVEGNANILSFVSINEKWENSHKMCAPAKGNDRIRTFTVKRNTYRVVK